MFDNRDDTSLKIKGRRFGLETIFEKRLQERGCWYLNGRNFFRCTLDAYLITLAFVRAEAENFTKMHKLPHGMDAILLSRHL